jgi:hypothetical protein
MIVRCFPGYWNGAACNHFRSGGRSIWVQERHFGEHRADQRRGVNTQPGGTTQVVRSTFDHNTSVGLGGAISNLGNTVLVRTLVTHNKGSSGGGIATGGANVLLSQSVVRNNIPDNCSPLNTIPGCVD